MRCIASGARPPDLSLRGGRRPTWQSRGTCRIIGKPSAKSQLPSRDCTPRALPRASRSGRHGPFGASQWHVRRVQRYTSALLPLNCPPQGGHYPQGARRIRKAAKPPTAAQWPPLQTQLVRAILTIAGTGRKCAAGPGCPLPYNARPAIWHNFPLSIPPPAHARPCLTPPMDSQLQTGGGSATMGRKRGRLPCWMCAIRA